MPKRTPRQNLIAYIWLAVSLFATLFFFFENYF